MQFQVKLQKNNRNNVVGRKQKTNKVLVNLFRGVKVKRKARLMF